MGLPSKDWRVVNPRTYEASLMWRPRELTPVLHTPFPPNPLCLAEKGSLLPLPTPPGFCSLFWLPWRSELPKILGGACGGAPACARRGAGSKRRARPILGAAAHPSAVRIGRAGPPRRGEAPERPTRLPIPTGCQNKSPSLSQHSGVQAAAGLPGAAALRSAGRWRVHPPEAPGSGPFRSPCAPAPEAAWPGARYLLSGAERAFTSRFGYPPSACRPSAPSRSHLPSSPPPPPVVVPLPTSGLRYPA